MFRNKAPPDAIDLVSKLLHYEPHLRLDPFEALTHSFFDELREPNARLPNGKPLPNLFNFTESEFKRMEAVGLSKKLVPPHLIKALRDKYKAVVIPTQPPVNPYASPYPHIITQMAALAQQQRAMEQMNAAQGAAAGSAAGATATAAAGGSGTGAPLMAGQPIGMPMPMPMPMPVGAPMVMGGQPYAGGPAPVQGQGLAPQNQQPMAMQPQLMQPQYAAAPAMAPQPMQGGGLPTANKPTA